MILISTQRFTQSILYTKRAEKLETRQPIYFKHILRKKLPDISGKPPDLEKSLRMAPVTKCNQLIETSAFIASPKRIRRSEKYVFVLLWRANKNVAKWEVTKSENQSKSQTQWDSIDHTEYAHKFADLTRYDINLIRSVIIVSHSSGKHQANQSQLIAQGN